MAKEVNKKNVVQDVIPPKRSIRNIELPSRAKALSQSANKSTNALIKPLPKQEDEVQDFTRPVSLNKPASTVPLTTVSEMKPDIKSSATSNIVKQAPPPPPQNTPSYKYEYDEPKKTGKKLLYVSSAILLIAVSFGISAFFKSAEIRVTPKTESKVISQIFLAKKDATGSELGFQLVTVTKSVEKTVSAGSEQKVDKKATGTIVVYNNYGTASQTLIATTRFQTSEGLIFHLIKETKIPGRQTIAGKIVAGSTEVRVEADQPGDAYNIGLKDFNIPGFKGGPKYGQIYARSKTEMTGGFSGMQKVVSSEVLTSADTELERTLKDSLSKDIISQIPANFVLYKNSISYTTSPVTQSSAVTDNAVLQKKGTANAIIFDKGLLSKSIFTKLAPELLNDVAKISNLEQLNFSYATSTGFNPSTDTSVSFKLSGEANFVWVFDENKLKADLLGLTKKNAETIISTYTAIKEAWVTTRPFWNQTIPNDPKKVTLINTISTGLTP